MQLYFDRKKRMRIVKLSVMTLSFILQSANVGISFYQAIPEMPDIKHKDQLATASLVIFLITLSLDLSMASHFAFIAISFVRIKLIKIKL